MRPLAVAGHFGAPLLGLLVAVMCVLAAPASASSELDLPGCRDHTLPRNDDGSSDAVTLPFRLDFYGTSYDSLYVNNNGNVTFDEPLSTYVPFDLTQTDRVIVAPFFADVDTRPAMGGTVTYGETSYAGATAFCVLWDDVGYYANQTDKRNTFQLLLVRKTPTAGDFDIVFRYESIQWELGEASDNVPARAGFSNGDTARSVEIAGSAEAGAFLNGGPASLASGSVNSGQAGTWLFRVQSGTSGNDPRNVPPGQARYASWWDWPDRDDDGLPDFWETDGVWVGEHLVNLPALGANPDRKDAFVYVDVVAGERWNDAIEGMLRASFHNSPLAIALHIVKGPRQLARTEVPSRVIADGPEGDAFLAAITKTQFASTGLAGSPGSVPALAKYVCACPDHVDVPRPDGRLIAGGDIGGEANGIRADHLVLTMYEARWIGEIERQTGVRFDNDALTGDRLNAVTTMHELGHLYGLRHRGQQDTPANERSYLSIMSYAYSAFGIPRPADEAIATGDLLPRIDYSRRDVINRDWRLGADSGALSLVYGQHGERGGFYTTVGEIPEAGSEAAPEASVTELLADPEIRASITEGARTLASPAVRPSAGTPHTPPTDRVKPKARIARLKVARLQGKGRKARATVTIRIVASDDVSRGTSLKIRCATDRVRLGRCKAGILRHKVRPGHHVFTLQVTDAAGNRTTVKKHFMVKAKRR
jgi:hypothetical protein